MSRYRIRRTLAIAIIGAGLIMALMSQGGDVAKITHTVTTNHDNSNNQALATAVLAQLPVKGRAPATGYTREQFGGAWANEGSCNMRDKILARDLTNVKFKNQTCEVETGQLNDPYTGKTIPFRRGTTTSSAIQIDHVVAIGNAWQTGAQQISQTEREKLYNDPLELLAVDGSSNQQKSDGDAATWLPPNKGFRCQYVARQIAVKRKYSLWVTRAEHDAMSRILNNCPDERLPTP